MVNEHSTDYEWGVQWDDGVIAYPSEEIARHEQAYPTRPDHVNPVMVRRAVGPWVRVYQSSLSSAVSLPARCDVHGNTEDCEFFHCPNQSVPPLAEGRRLSPGEQS